MCQQCAGRHYAILMAALTAAVAANPIYPQNNLDPRDNPAEYDEPGRLVQRTLGLLEHLTNSNDPAVLQHHAAGVRLLTDTIETGHLVDLGQFAEYASDFFDQIDRVIQAVMLDRAAKGDPHAQRIAANNGIQVLGSMLSQMQGNPKLN